MVDLSENATKLNLNPLFLLTERLFRGVERVGEQKGPIGHPNVRMPCRAL